MSAVAALIVVCMTSVAVEGACPAGIDPIDLSTVISPYRSTTAGLLNLRSLLPQLLIDCGSDYNDESDDVTSGVMFTVILEPGQSIFFRQIGSNYDSRHLLRYGDVKQTIQASCPGDFLVKCNDDPDNEQFTWQNTVGRPQRIFFIQTGFEESLGDFVLEWNILNGEGGSAGSLQGTCSMPIDLSRLSPASSTYTTLVSGLPYTSSTLGMPKLSPTPSETCDSDEDANSSADTPAMVFVMSVGERQTVTLRALQGKYHEDNTYIREERIADYSTDSTHMLRYGGACPGDKLADECYTDAHDGRIMSWNNSLGPTQNVYFVQYGIDADDSDDEGSFELQWNIRNNGDLEGTCSSPIDLSSLSSPYSSSTLGMPNMRAPLEFCGSFRDDYNDYDDEPVTSPAKVFVVTLQPGQEISLQPTDKRYHGLHMLRYGGKCPGNHEAVSCHHDSDGDHVILRWINFLSEPQQVYYIQSGYNHASAHAGDFVLSWTPDFRTSSPSLSDEAIVGAVVGIVLVVAITTIAAVLCCMMRRKQAIVKNSSPTASSGPSLSSGGIERF